MNDGSLIVTERSVSGSTDQFVVSKFDFTGAPVPSFGTNGTMTFASGADYSDEDAQALVKIQSTGKMIVVGEVMVNSHKKISITRIKGNGTVDMSFGTEGTMMLDFGNNLDNSIADFMILPNDNILLWGNTETTQDGKDITVARLAANGTLDPTFGSSGVYQYGHSAYGNKNDQALDVVLQPDGKMIVTGSSNDGTFDRWLVIRLNTNLTVDTSFGINGEIYIAQGGPAGETAYQGKITKDHHLIVSGASSNSSGTMDARIMKLNLGYNVVMCP